jgi:hypothetical protein
MVATMEYSAGMVSQVFAFVETREIARLMAEGLSKEGIKAKVESENLYPLKNPDRLRRTFNYVYKRLSSLPDGAVELLVQADMENAIISAEVVIWQRKARILNGKSLGETSI